MKKKKKPSGKPVALRDRIKEFRRVKASSLVPNPKNFRTHTAEQRKIYRQVISEVGFAGAELVRELPDGSLMLIDGHMRREEHGDEELPVLVTDLTEHEADVLLATFDPVAALAGVDATALESLVASVESDAVDLLHGQDEADDKPGPNDADIDLEYSLMIDCESEGEQLQILKGLNDAGVEARAICAGYVKKTEKPEPSPLPKIESGGRKIVRQTEVMRTPRVKQIEGLFDMSPTKSASREWTLDFSLDEKPWQIGLIVGPSGSGKSTIAAELFGNNLIAGWQWPADKSVIDGFPEVMSIHDVSGLLSSVGFSSPPGWLKPFHVLSNGEQFRVNLARTLAESPQLAVVDEFTSVVDRTVAKIGSSALAKTVRASGCRFVAVACHYDIEEWLNPDWKYDTATGTFAWRLLRRRPEIQLQIRRVDTSHWPMFAQHHYLSHSIHRAAKCFVAFVDGRPAAFASVIHSPGKGNEGWWREHRTVCLPDFQGVGIGNALSEFVGGAMRATGKDYRSITTHPAMIRHRHKSPLWEMVRSPSFTNIPTGKNEVPSTGWNRPTASFRFVGEPRYDEAKLFGVIK